MIPAKAVEAGTISEVLTRHVLTSNDSCSCEEMFYDSRMTGPEVAREHALHVEKLLIDAGYVASSVYVDPARP